MEFKIPDKWKKIMGYEMEDKFFIKVGEFFKGRIGYTRIYTILHYRFNVIYVGDLVLLSEDDLKKEPGIGPKSIKLINNYLLGLNLKLGMKDLVAWNTIEIMRHKKELFDKRIQHIKDCIYTDSRRGNNGKNLSSEDKKRIYAQETAKFIDFAAEEMAKKEDWYGIYGRV